MDKKGTIWTIVGTAIALVFLAVIILSIFCPGKCLAPLLAAGSEAIADTELGSIRKEKFEKTTLVSDPEVEKAYNNILDILRSGGNGPCILKHEPLPSDFKGFKIALSITQDDTFIQLINKKGQSVHEKTVAGKPPCVVGEGVAENFYDNFLDGSKCKTNCPPNAIEASIVITGKEEIYVNGVKKDLKDNNLLFKAIDGNVCFFPTDSADYADYICGKKKKGIDVDCFDVEIQDNIIACEQMSIPFAQELLDKGYSSKFRDIAVEFSNAIKRAVNSEKDVCRVEFGYYPNFGDDQKITMYDIGGNLQVEAQGKNKNSVILQFKTNFVPCIVHGQNFWKWLQLPEEDTIARDNQHIDKSGVTLRGDGKNGVQFAPKDDDNKDKRDLYYLRPLIYKIYQAGKGHICITQIWNEGQCKMDENIKRNAVAKGCLEKDEGDFLEIGRTPIC